MDTKLTLKLDETVIVRAKQYASERKISLSRLVENYLDSLTQEASEDVEITPFVRSISTGISIPLDIDLKKVRADYLDEKYK